MDITIIIVIDIISFFCYYLY